MSGSNYDMGFSSMLEAITDWSKERSTDMANYFMQETQPTQLSIEENVIIGIGMALAVGWLMSGGGGMYRPQPSREAKTQEDKLAEPALQQAEKQDTTLKSKAPSREAVTFTKQETSALKKYERRIDKLYNDTNKATLTINQSVNKDDYKKSIIEKTNKRLQQQGKTVEGNNYSAALDVTLKKMELNQFWPTHFGWQSTINLKHHCMAILDSLETESKILFWMGEFSASRCLNQLVNEIRDSASTHVHSGKPDRSFYSDLTDILDKYAKNDTLKNAHGLGAALSDLCSRIKAFLTGSTYHKEHKDSEAVEKVKDFKKQAESHRDEQSDDHEAGNDSPSATR